MIYIKVAIVGFCISLLLNVIQYILTLLQYANRKHFKKALNELAYENSGQDNTCMRLLKKFNAQIEEIDNEIKRHRINIDSNNVVSSEHKNIHTLTHIINTLNSKESNSIEESLAMLNKTE